MEQESSDDLPYGYQDDDVFENVAVVPEEVESLSGYSSDDGGEFQMNSSGVGS